MTERNAGQRSRPRRFLIRGGLVLFSVLLGLVVIEGVVRALDLRPPKRGLQRGNHMAKSSLPGLPYELRPDSKVTWTYWDTPDAEAREVLARINEHGFRGESVKRVKDEGTFRIACIGDSVTFGHGVPDDRTWPAALERELRSKADSMHVEVMNWGISGVDTVAEVALLEGRILDFDPDLVLLAYFHNDASKTDNVDGFELQGPSWLLRATGPRKSGSTAWMREHWRTLDLVFDRIHRTIGKQFVIEKGRGLYNDRNPGWRSARRSLARADALLEREGIPFRVLLYPYLVRVDEHLGGHDAYVVVKGFLEEQSLGYFDLEPAFIDRDVGSLRNHPYDAHPNPEAHGIAAEGIAEYLWSEGLLDALGERR